MNRLMQIVIIICFCLGMMTLDCFAESEIPIYPAWEITLSPARTGGTGGSLYVSNNNTEIATEEAYKTYLSYSLNGIDKSRVTSALIEAVCTQGAVGEKEKLQIYGVPEPIDMISPDTIHGKMRRVIFPLLQLPSAKRLCFWLICVPIRKRFH